MKTRYIDAHCHLQFKQYAPDREEIIARMREEGVAGIVVGTDYESSVEAIALAEKYEHLYASVGLHPGSVGQESFDTEKFRALAKHPKVVAIGECGLDFFHSERNEVQKEVFKEHLALAAELDKPLIIHVRDAYPELLAILKEAKKAYPNLYGDIHFFTGSLAEAEELTELGFTISFTAVITFSHDYDELIRAVPLTNILAETDAPYVAPTSRRGERNDPLAVIDVVGQIAAIRGEDEENVRFALLATTRRIFALQAL